jgi:MFS family permease
MDRNAALYPWHQFCVNLLFWQATWFLYFQSELSAAQAILLYGVYDVSVTTLEVPSGYMSDRVGRRVTLVLSALAFLTGLILLSIGGSFAVFVAGQVLFGAGMAFRSGTDTALLYQSLAAAGRAEEMEAQSLRAWRFSFSGLAFSAVVGGAMALYADRLPFVASALAMVAVLVLTLRFAEPPRIAAAQDALEADRLRQLLRQFRLPPVLWLFALGVLMYGFSHVPFVFGQPFIAETLGSWAEIAAPELVSGAVTTAMMLISVAVSMGVPRLRARIGLRGLLLGAFALQIAISAGLALSASALAIGWLLLRMVPDALSTPFILARLQPLLGDESRATFLSLKSFCGKLLFAATLWLAAGSTRAAGEMPLGDIQRILGWYTLAGVVCVATLAVAALRVPLDPPARIRKGA